MIRIIEDMGLVESRGSGIPTMIDVMLNHGRTPPKFEETHGDFVVSFFGTSEKNDLAPGSSDDTINDTLNGTLNLTASKIIEIIKRDSNITVEKISVSIGVSVRTVKRCLTELQNNGIIKRVGAKKMVLGILLNN